MKILLTGGTGFLGSHLLKAFIRNNHQVIILKRSTSNLWRIEKEITKTRFYNSDTIDMKQVFEENKNIDTIVHTATCYGRNGESLKQMLSANLTFPLEILEYAALYNVESFWNTDTTLLRNLNNYALSKSQFLDWGKQFSDEKKIRFYNLKTEHMYGKLDDESKFITYILKQCIANEKIDLTSGEQKRDFIYVEDVVMAYNFLLSSEKISDTYFKEFEIGTGISIKIKDVVEIIKNATKSQAKLNFGALKYRKNETMDSKANLEELKNLGLNIEDMVTFRQGIEFLLEELRD